MKCMKIFQIVMSAALAVGSLVPSAAGQQAPGRAQQPAGPAPDTRAVAVALHSAQTAS